jgi:hypothetical protein
MVQACRAEAWTHTARVMALIAEIHRDKTKRKNPFTAADFDPTKPKPKPVPMTATEQVMKLRAMFVKAKPKK